MAIELVQCGICGSAESSAFYVCRDCSEIYCNEHVPDGEEECPCQEHQDQEEATV